MRWLVTILILGFTIGWFSAEGSSYSTASTVIDVSWPNCDLQRPQGAFAGIVGVNGGLAFRLNPCLAKQAGWFKHLSVYVNTGYPGSSGRRFANSPRACAADDNQCLAYNYGFNAGRYAVKQALVHGVLADRWWLDVESDNSWAADPMLNRASLNGTLDAVSRLVGREHVGFYSYPGQWEAITGKWKNGFPDWVATGRTSISDAVTACATSFTGGKTLMAQYISGVDKNYVCKV